MPWHSLSPHSQTGHSARLYPTPCDRLLQVTDSQNNRSEYSREHPNFIRPGKEHETDSPDPSWYATAQPALKHLVNHSHPDPPQHPSPSRSFLCGHRDTHYVSSLTPALPWTTCTMCKASAPRAPLLNSMYSWQLGGRGHPRALADNHGWLQTCPNKTLMIKKMSRTSPCTRVTGLFVKQTVALREVNYWQLIGGWRKTWRGGDHRSGQTECHVRRVISVILAISAAIVL